MANDVYSCQPEPMQVVQWTGGASVFMRPDTPPIHFIIAALIAEVKCCPAQFIGQRAQGRQVEFSEQSAQSTVPSRA